jgi:hypothetical protein
MLLDIGIIVAVAVLIAVAAYFFAGLCVVAVNLLLSRDLQRQSHTPAEEGDMEGYLGGERDDRG